MFREQEMRTFADWLEYYNNLDVEPLFLHGFGNLPFQRCSVAAGAVD